jgi:glyoxylase-like metal-dependent hydrolase (beta-lactamase superfamily II)
MPDENSTNEPVANGVRHLKILFVNAYFVDTPENGENSWVLIDTGIPLSGGRIRAFAKKLYSANAKPTAIILTHGDFDHAGAVHDLAESWNVPVYSRRLEMPYLTGKSDYPPQDPTVGGAPR